jgi:hypothetical protein
MIASNLLLIQSVRCLYDFEVSSTILGAEFVPVVAGLLQEVRPIIAQITFKISAVVMSKLRQNAGGVLNLFPDEYIII